MAHNTTPMRHQLSAHIFKVSRQGLLLEVSANALASLTCCLTSRCPTGLDHWELAVAENLAGACRSVLMGLATMQVRNISSAGPPQQGQVHQGLQKGFVHT